MSTKIKAPKQSKKGKNPNTNYYILIGVMAAIIIAVVAIITHDYISSMPPKSNVTDNSMSQDKESISQSNTEKIEFPQTTEENFLEIIDKSDAKKVEFTMTDGQKFTMEVYPKVAPVTAENFLSLVEEGFYDGLTFHRIIEGFMAQGGAYDPENQANDPAESIIGEFASNGVENNLAHYRGVVSMARTDDPDSASSQFFICYDRAGYLDGEYAAFGYVTEGMETVDSFLSDGTDMNDAPLKEVKIKTAKIVE